MKAIVQRENGDWSFAGTSGNVYSYKLKLASQTAEGANAADAIDQVWQVCDGQGNPVKGNFLVHFIGVASTHEIGVAFTGIAMVAATGYLVYAATATLQVWCVTAAGGTVNIRITQTGASATKRVGATMWGGLSPLTVTDLLTFV